MPQSYGHPGAGASQAVFNSPNLPEYAWPTYASYPNYAQVTYPKQYSASAWPYIGPFYPYPQIPMGWRQVQLDLSGIVRRLLHNGLTVQGQRHGLIGKRLSAP